MKWSFSWKPMTQEHQLAHKHELRLSVPVHLSSSCLKAFFKHSWRILRAFLVNP